MELCVFVFALLALVWPPRGLSGQPRERFRRTLLAALLLSGLLLGFAVAGACGVIRLPVPLW
jgi:hypothetical protein